MGTVLVKIKIMPASPESSFEEIKNSAREIIEKKCGKNITFEEIPIAFGLKAIVVGFGVDEETGEIEPIENEIRSIKDVGSTETIDMRRALE